MNANQRSVLFTAVLLIIGMFVYSPRVSGYGQPVGYHFYDEKWWVNYPIDLHRIAYQVGILLVIVALLVLALKKPSNE